jgi:adenylate cyclase
VADIFISYSSKDREKAEQLTELLSSAGLSVWIDRQGIGAATSWSGEITRAISDCKALVVMLSPFSVESKNVVREVSLAFEKNKKILPLDLEPVALTDDLAYHLAGLQRTSMTNIDSIIRALGKIGLEATHAPTMQLVKETDGRKSLMVLPLEDLSPTADNQWFADGLAAELISALSNVRSLRVTDQQSTKEFKSYKGHLAVYAKEMSIRYFIQGSVRKFGDQIKIACSLLDIETGDHLWQDSLKGTMEDIFDIQEKVAENVVEGLKIYLAPDEKKKLSEHSTDNAEAYELYLKGNEYFPRQTKVDFERALVLYEEAVRLDPGYSTAHAMIANTTQEMYRAYSRSPSLLERGEQAADRVRELEGETAMYAWVKSLILHNQGDVTASLLYAKRAVAIDPTFVPGYTALGLACKTLRDFEGAIAAITECIRLRENILAFHFNLLVLVNELPHTSENRRKHIEFAQRAIIVFERHVRLNPDDYHARVQLANALQMADRREESLREADRLSKLESLDGAACYNLACLYIEASNSVQSLILLQRSIEKGYYEIETFRLDPDLDPLRGTPEFNTIIQELEEKIEKQQNG